MMNFSLQFIGRASKSLIKKRPLSAQWFVTSKCNCRCHHCSVWQKKGRDVPLDECLNGLDLLKKMGVCLLGFNGGEASLHPHIIEICKYAKKRGFIVGTSSNGAMFSNESFVNEISKHLDSVWISLDSLDAKKHEWFRRYPGLYKKTIEALRLLQEKNVKTFVGSVLLNMNVDEIPNIVKFVNSFGHVAAINILQTDRRENKSFQIETGDMALAPPKDKALKSIDSVLKLKKEGYKILNSNFHLESAKKVICGERCNFCRAFERFIVVNMDSKIAPCNLMPSVLKLDEKTAEGWDSITREYAQLYHNKDCCFWFCYFSSSEPLKEIITSVINVI